MFPAAELVKCLNCSRSVTSGTSYCVKHVVGGVGRPFVLCSQSGCDLPCRGAAVCVVHSGGVARCTFEEDVLLLHRKRLQKRKLLSLGVLRSQHAGSDDEEEADVAVPSWRVHVLTSTASPLLQMHLESEDGVAFEGSRKAKLRKVEQMYELQLSRLEDVMRSCDNNPSNPLLASVRAWSDPVTESRAPDLAIELSQREAGTATCKRKGCSAFVVGPSPFCVTHILDDPKQNLFGSCNICKITFLRTWNPGAETCPTHTPSAPKMMKPQ